MTPEVLNHAIQQLIETTQRLADDYASRVKNRLIPEGDDLDCMGIAAYYQGGVAALQELAFRLYLINPEIKGGY